MTARMRFTPEPAGMVGYVTEVPDFDSELIFASLGVPRCRKLACPETVPRAADCGSVGSINPL